MKSQDKILAYLLAHRKENKYRLATALKLDVEQVMRALDLLQDKGIIGMNEGNAVLMKEKRQKGKRKPKEKRLEIRVKEERLEKIEEPKEVEEKIGVTEEPTEKEGEENRIGGTVKFYNPNKGLVCIMGENGEKYYVHKDELQGIAIEKGDKVSFKVVQGDKGSKAEKVEKISERIEGVH